MSRIYYTHHPLPEVGCLLFNAGEQELYELSPKKTTLEMAHSLGLVGRDESGKYFDFDSSKKAR